MAVRNHAVINEVVDFKTLTGSLQRQITQMQDEKSRLVARNVDLENEILRLREEVDELRKMHQTTTSGAVSSSLLSSMPASQQQVHAPIPSLTATDAHRPLQIHVRPSSAFGAPSPRTGPLTSFNNENVAPMSMVQPNTPSAYFGQSVHNSADPAWELRERELVAKFSNIIQHLQVEIAKQNFAQTTAVPPSPVTKAHQNHTSMSSNNVGNLAAMGSNNSANAPYAQILASLLQSVTGPSAASQAPPKVMAAHTHPITPVASSSQPPLVEGEVVVDQLVNSIVSIPALRNRLVERLQQAASQ
jgi:regulator of replication initiation timing